MAVRKEGEDSGGVEGRRGGERDGGEMGDESKGGEPGMNSIGREKLPD